jgi:hypothetical protein
MSCNVVLHDYTRHRWVDDEQALLKFGTTRVFTLMDGTAVEITTEERRPKCFLVPSIKVQKVMRKTRRIMGRNADFIVINVTMAMKQPTIFHT